MPGSLLYFLYFDFIMIQFDAVVIKTYIDIILELAGFKSLKELTSYDNVINRLSSPKFLGVKSSSLFRKVQRVSDKFDPSTFWVGRFFG